MAGTKFQTWLAAHLSVLIAGILFGAALSDVAIHADLSALGAAVSPRLFGLNLEFTRHDLFEGLSAQMLANRKFARQVPSSDWSFPGPGGWPQSDLAPPRWYVAGPAKSDVPGSGAAGGDSTAVRCDLGDVSSFCEVGQIQVGSGFDAGARYGSAIALQAGRSYDVRLLARVRCAAAQPTQPCAHATVSLSGSSGLFVFSRDYLLSDTGAEWQTLSASFASSVTLLNATFAVRIVPWSGNSAVVWLGAASLMPSDNVFGGLRRDVVESLKRLSFGGSLRYPGGCFAAVAGPWTSGLLPPDRSPTIHTPPNYCAAVPGGVNAYTDGFLDDWIGIDEYIQLCRHVDAEPAITLQLQFGTDEEVELARSWVEYCNGDATATRWGRVRASRGFEAPYRVRLWYLGNEINLQGRFPNYPSEPSLVKPPPSAAEYRSYMEKLIPALLLVDPNLDLFSVGGASQSWEGQIFSSALVRESAVAESFHAGYAPQPSNWTADELERVVMFPSEGFAAALSQLHQLLATANASKVGISADEWGLGPPWCVNGTPFSVAHAVYGASFLSAAAGRYASSFNIVAANYFEPINEGAIIVSPFSSELTPIGQVMHLYGRHAKELLSATQYPIPGDVGHNLEVLVTSNTADHVLARVTVLNRNATAAIAMDILLSGVGVVPGTGAVCTFLVSSGFGKASTFSTRKSVVPLRSYTGSVSLQMTLPAFSVVQCAISAAGETLSFV